MDIRTTITQADKRQVYEALQKWCEPILRTMGAKGEVVIISRPDGNIYTQDGVTVARNLAPDDPFERTIIRAVVDAAWQTVKEVGDGTTTTTALVLSLFKELAFSTTDGELQMTQRLDYYQGLVDAAKEHIREHAVPILEEGRIDLDALTAVATVSCHNNKKLGEVIADLVAKVGADGDIKVETSHTGKTYTEYNSGYVARSGMINMNFITNPLTQTAELSNPVVVIADQIIDDTDEIMAILNAYKVHVKADMKNNPLVIICDDMQGGALNTLINNLPQISGQRQSVPAVVIKAPMSGRRRQELLDDYAAITGAFVFRKIGGIPVGKINQNLDVSPFGRIDRIVADKDKSVLYLEDRSQIEAQVEKLRKVRETVKDEADQDFIDERISRLTSGIGKIYVGGETGAENIRTNALVDDAVKASLQALKHGVSPGGGKALAAAGVHIVNTDLSTALLYPMERINHGPAKPPIEYWQVKDARDGKVKDAWEAGILDPAIVPITALTKAFSVVSQLLMSETFLIIKDVSNEVQAQ